MKAEEIKSCRESYWGELTLAEKVERMRDIVKSLESMINRLGEEVYLLNGHCPKTPIPEEHQIGKGKDDVYF